VRLFSPWSYVIDKAARRLLETTGWTAPDTDAYPTGADVVRQYLEPLAAHPGIKPALRLRTRVVGVTRFGTDKLKTAGRAGLPFELVVDSPDGQVRILARAVIDASGTWQSPNPLGTGGLPAVGEVAAADLITYRIPDATGAERDAYAGKTTLVVGAGHSAFNTILDLARLATEVENTRVLWAVRREAPEGLFSGGAKDVLSQRAVLGRRVGQLVEAGEVRLVTGFRATDVVRAGGRVVVSGIDPDGVPVSLEPVDRVVVNTGFRPDLAMTSELRVELDSVVEAPVKLAPLIDPNVHTCGTVRPHGTAELAHPEPGFYAVGMKSYGRAPTFLLLTGYEQVRSVVAELMGDHDGAASVELQLPETVAGVDADARRVAGHREGPGVPRRDVVSA
jgi:thioredoxin reductase